MSWVQFFTKITQLIYIFKISMAEQLFNAFLIQEEILWFNHIYYIFIFMYKKFGLSTNHNKTLNKDFIDSHDLGLMHSELQQVC